MVNAVMGAAVVGPGDIDGLQEDLLEACRTIMIKVPEKVKLKNG
jgi:hypothetical protein